MPTDIPETQTSQVCPNRANPGTASEFFVTGRGGLPSSPINLLRGDQLLADWVALENTSAENTSKYTSSDQVAHPSSEPLVEAQGWEKGAQGEVIFVAQTSALNSLPDHTQSAQVPIQCQ